MKKSLIAIAALAAVSAASAQSSVTLYGLVDIGYGAHSTTSRDGSVFLKSSGVMDGSNAGNRIGFRGTEDLGGGLRANFVVEQGISPTSPTVFAQRAGGSGQQIVGQAGTAFTTATNRQSYLGLSSASMGTLNIGYTYTNAYELSTLSGYMVGSEQIGGLTHAAGIGAGATNIAGGARANGLTYISPNFSGFTVRAQYGATTSAESITSNANIASTGLTTDKARRMGLMLQYANGPLSAALAYTTVNFQAIAAGAAGAAAGATTNVFGVVSNPQTFNPVTGLANAIVAGAALNNNSRTANLTQLGASYDFGVAKLAGTYNTGKNGGTATSTDNTTVRAYQIGVSAPFGAFSPFLMIGKQTFKNQVTAVNSSDVRSTQLGVRYSLSKRTTAYVMYGSEVDNAVVAAAGANYKSTKSIIGVAHSF
jgi:predicted porin